MRSKHGILIPLIFGIGVILGGFLGCSFLLEQEETVTLPLPQFPRSWMGRDTADGFEIVYMRNGKEVRHSVPFGLGTTGLTLPLGKRTPLVLYPSVTGKVGTVSLYPAGGLYPDFFHSGALDIHWEDGFAAETLLLAARVGFPLDTFNCARFFEEARKRGGSNPWELNRVKVLETLAAGSFRADRFALKKKYVIPLSLSPGEWSGENLLEPPLAVEKEGTVLSREFTWGLHRYWSKGHSFTIQVSENGRVETAEYDGPLENAQKEERLTYR